MWATGYILDAWSCDALAVHVRAYEELVILSLAPEHRLQFVMSLNQNAACKDVLSKLIRDGTLKVWEVE